MLGCSLLFNNFSKLKLLDFRSWKLWFAAAGDMSNLNFGGWSGDDQWRSCCTSWTISRCGIFGFSFAGPSGVGGSCICCTLLMMVDASKVFCGYCGTVGCWRCGSRSGQSLALWCISAVGTMVTGNGGGDCTYFGGAGDRSIFANLSIRFSINEFLGKCLYLP